MRWPSRYTIFVPLPKRNAYLLAHGYTGALDLVETHTAEMLLSRTAASQPITVHDFGAETRQYLEERGFISEMEAEGEVELVAGLARELRRRLERSPRTWYLMPTYDCQLCCTYCFESPVRRHALRGGTLGVVMSDTVIAAAFRAIDQLDAERRSRSLGLYGGEPLLRSNRACIEAIVDAGNRRGYAIMAATNGVDLETYFDLLGPGRIAALHVPLDGLPATHNAQRRSRDGQPTFNTILRNIREALDRQTRIKMRVNVTRAVLGQLEVFTELLDQAGLLGAPGFRCYLQAVFPSKRLASGFQVRQRYVTDAEIAEWLGDHSQSAAALSGQSIVDGRVRALYASQVWRALTPAYCSAMGNILVLDPHGAIYPCNNVVGLTEQVIGRFWPDLLWEDEPLRQWRQRSIDGLPACLRCPYALICGGGCAYRALIEHGSISVSHCDAFGQQFAGLLRAGLGRVQHSAAPQPPLP